MKHNNATQELITTMKNNELQQWNKSNINKNGTQQ